MKKVSFSKILALLLCLALVLSTAPLSIAAEEEEKTFSVATLNDIHYYPECLAGNKTEAFYTYLTGHNCVYNDLDAIMEAALASLEYEVKNNGVKHIVLAGDLTTNGEYEGHKALSKMLLDFEERTGAKIYVTPGNHDINNSRASTFVNDKKEEARKTSPSEFYEFYKDLGFSDAYHKFSSFDNGTHGSLTYSVKTEDGYRLILADAGKFTSDITESGENEQETAGTIQGELLEWVLSEAEDAKKNGETPLLFTHWNMSGISYMHEFVLQGFVIDDGYILQETLADAGINYTFSAHQHVSDVDITYSDSGNPMYSVITPTLTQFPFSYRVTDFKKNSEGGLDVTFNMRSCDEYEGVKAISGNGTYPSPYRHTGFYKQVGGHADASDFLFGILKSTLDKYVNAIRAEGSIVSFVEKEMGIDIESTINRYLMGGIYIDNEKVISGENVMSFLDDLDSQLMNKYIYQKSETYDIIKDALDSLMAIEVASVPCTKFIRDYGFGSADRNGTLGDAFLSILVYMYVGNEDISDDPFMQEVIEFSGKTEFLDLLIENIRKVVVEDILINDILAGIDFNIDSLFVGKTATIGEYIDMFYTILLSILGSGIMNSTSPDEFFNAFGKLSGDFGDVSLKKLIETVLSTGLISYGSTIDELIDSLLDQFLPTETKEAIVYQAKIVIGGIVSDEDRDWDVTYTNNGPVKVIPTKEDMQLPVNVTMSMTDNNSSSFTVSWFTKYSVTETDIEVVKKGEEFTGTPTENAVTVSEESTYSAPGFDCGAFAILPYTLKTVKHTATVTGLEADTEYIFRIGDFTKGFTVDGSIKTAPLAEGKFTFIHVSDTEGLAPSHYEAFSDTLTAAEALYPDSSFIVHTGNLVSKPENDDQWSWAIEGNSGIFMSKPFVYASGTNDMEGNGEISKYFSVTNAPAQLDNAGVYYSFNYGNAHFVVINSNSKNSLGTLSKEQTDWLKDDLRESDADWNILVMHESLYSDTTEAVLKTQLFGIMDDFGVDLVLQGSDTAYVRTKLLKNGEDADYSTKTVDFDGTSYKTYYNTDGSIAVISGSTADSITSGENNYGNTEVYDNTALPMFSAITIDGNLLYVNGFKVNGDKTQKTDRFAIEKDIIDYMTGDVNGDGKVSAADARLALRYSVGLENLTVKAVKAADVDRSASVTASDARTILRVSVGLEAFEKK